LKIEEIESIIESILFASGNPMPISKIAETLELDIKTAESLLKNFADKYNSQMRGLKILYLDGEYQLVTRPEYADYIKKAMDNRRETSLSSAAFEVLAIVAYNQPITRGYVSQVRGVESGEVMDKLIEKGLLEECGRLDAPGRPRLYRTTSEFLRVFGLSSIDDLPPLDSDEEPTLKTDFSENLDINNESSEELILK